MGHSTCGESSCRLSSCLLWGPRKEFTPLCPNCCLATRGERKFSILSQTWEKVEALSPFGHNTIQLFIFPVVITHALEISAVTRAFSTPWFHSCTKTNLVRQHYVPMCLCFLCWEETVVNSAVQRSSEQQCHFSLPPEEKLRISCESQLDDWHLAFFPGLTVPL